MSSGNGSSDLSKPNVQCVGIDLGTAGIAIGKASSNGTVDILLTETGSRRIPPALSFQGKQRLIGQPAMDMAISNMQNTIVDCIQNIHSVEDKYSSDTTRSAMCLTRVPHSLEKEVASHSLVYTVQYQLGDLEEIALSTDQIIAILLHETIRMLPQEESYNIVVAVPDAFSLEDQQHIANGCVLASDLSANKNLNFFLTPASECMRQRFIQQYSARSSLSSCGKEKPISQAADDVDVSPCTSKYAVLVNVGKAFTTFGVGRLDADSGQLDLLHTMGFRFGCDDLDAALATHINEKLNTNNVSVNMSKREGVRLLNECAHTRKVLSANRSASFVLECIGPEDRSFQFDISRELFEQVCADPLQRFRAALSDMLEQAQVTNDMVSVVEMTGGGTCIPVIQNVLAEVCGDETKLSCTLDRSECIVIGASLIAYCANNAQSNTTASATDTSVSESTTPADVKTTTNVSISPVTLNLSSETYASHIQQLKSSQQQDTAMQKIADARNHLEAYVLGIRTLATGNYRELYKQKPTDEVIDATLDWLSSHDTQNVTSEDVFIEKLNETRTQIESINLDLFKKKHTDDEARAMEAEEQRQKWSQERAKEVTEDHDFRQLPFSKRMQQVLRNKQEATELFKDGNYAHATARYVRALALTGKFIDLSTEEKVEADSIQCILHLNLAMCYIKQSAWTKAVAECDEALKIEPSNVKGLYRKATALENLKDFSAAIVVARNGLKITPNDVALGKLLKRVEAKKAKEVEKEKKLYSKMFS